MIALTGRCQATIRAFSGFPAVSLPRLRFHRKIACKAMIATEFSRQRESEKNFSLSFPSRQGKGEAALPCLHPFGAAAASGSGVADPASQSPLLRSERFLDRRRDAEIGLEQPAEEARSERAQWIDRDLRVGG